MTFVAIAIWGAFTTMLERTSAMLPVPVDLLGNTSTGSASSPQFHIAALGSRPDQFLLHAVRCLWLLVNEPPVRYYIWDDQKTVVTKVSCLPNYVLFPFLQDNSMLVQKLQDCIVARWNCQFVGWIWWSNQVLRLHMMICLCSSCPLSTSRASGVWTGLWLLNWFSLPKTALSCSGIVHVWWLLRSQGWLHMCSNFIAS